MAIAIGNSGDQAFLPQLKLWAAGDDAVLVETALWAIDEIHRKAAGEPPSASASG